MLETHITFDEMEEARNKPYDLYRSLTREQQDAFLLGCKAMFHAYNMWINRHNLASVAFDPTNLLREFVFSLPASPGEGYSLANLLSGREV